MAQTLSREEFMALHELAKARRMALQNMFNGTKLVFGTAEALVQADQIKNGIVFTSKFPIQSKPACLIDDDIPWVQVIVT